MCPKTTRASSEDPPKAQFRVSGARVSVAVHHPQWGQVQLLGLAQNPCRCGEPLPRFRCTRCGVRLCGSECQRRVATVGRSRCGSGTLCGSRDLSDTFGEVVLR